MHPLVGQTIDRLLPENASIIILGGGIGGSVTASKGKGRRFVNIELGEVEGALIRSFEGDMEDPRTFARIVRKRSLAFLTPFSAEYTDVGVTSANIAGTLVSGEKWLWVCHHADSVIVVEFRRTMELKDTVDRLGQKALNVKSWDSETKSFAREIALSLRGAYPGIIDPIQIVDLPLHILRRRIGEMEESFSANIDARFALALFRLGAESPVDRARSTGRILSIKQEMEDAIEITHPVVDRPRRTPSNLLLEVDLRLDLVESSQYENDGTMVIFGLFEKK